MLKLLWVTGGLSETGLSTILDVGHYFRTSLGRRFNGKLNENYWYGHPLALNACGSGKGSEVDSIEGSHWPPIENYYPVQYL